MTQSLGYATLTDRESGNVTAERDAFTCRHCSRIVHVKPKARPEDVGGLCKCCMGLICPLCLGGNCTPWVERIARYEARLESRRSMGL